MTTPTTTPQSPGNNDTELAHQVIAACQNAIKKAVAQPSNAIALASAFGGALTSLRLVQSEVAKGDAGARAVVEHADALTRHALKDVLAHAADPKRALDILATTSAIVPSGTSAPSGIPATAAAPPSAAGASQLPTFSEVSDAYIAMRIANDGEGHPQIPSLRSYQRTFRDVEGDRRVDKYFPSDLQHYVSTMQFFPANASKRAEFAGKSTLEIIEANKNLALPPLSRKTLSDGYVAFIRAMMRAGMADAKYHDPFSGVKIRWPQLQQAPVPREGISLEVLDRVFRTGTASGYLDEALLPLWSALTSRRLGMGAYLRGADIREKYGVMVAQTSGVVLENGRWRRIPIKNDESAGFYVVHDFLSKIGFVDWARKQEGWVFAAAHEHPDPAKYESKVMNRLLRRCGATGSGEVFHSLRGDSIDAMRGAKVQGRTRRLQAGHELGDVHDKYGHRALKAKECKRLASLPLPKGIDWKAFDNLDFDALAARRRGPGRRRG